MKEMLLKYGCNPNQSPARIHMKNGKDLPFSVLNGRPGYINFLDALNAWQLVKSLKESLHTEAAASFKHVSPAGAALGLSLSEEEKQMYFAGDIEGLDDSPIACAYARARGADRLSSFGDFIALSGVCDAACARLIAREVSDGIIAPGYSEEALLILKAKRGGNYAVIAIDEGYSPEKEEERDVFGIRLSQGYNDSRIDETLLTNIVSADKNLPDFARRDLILALITLKYTQSNSVCYSKNGQVIGNGAGQQSRVHCTRLAGAKADLWHLRQHPKTLALPFKEDIKRPERDNAIDLYLSDVGEEMLENPDFLRLFTQKPEALSKSEKDKWLQRAENVCLGSDAFFPFSDNIERAKQSGVSYIAQPGGSLRDAEVIAACDRLGIVMAFTGLRLFHH